MKRSIPFNYQELTTVDEHPSSTLYTPSAAGTSNTNQTDYRLLPHYYSPPQYFPQHPPQHLCQHPHQLVEAPQQQILEYLGGYNENRYCESLPILEPNYHDQPQQGSTSRVSFWKAFNTVVSNAKSKEEEVKENQRWLVYDSSSSSVVAVENMSVPQTVAVTAGASLGECHVSHVSARETIGVDDNQVVLLSGKKHDSKRRRNKKKTKVEEEIGLMSGFFKKLVKGVINEQEVLQKKFVEVIERMERERVEREEAWRRQESEMYEREAAAREYERDLAWRRESFIVSTIEKITGTTFTSSVSGRKGKAV